MKARFLLNDWVFASATVVLFLLGAASFVRAQNAAPQSKQELDTRAVKIAELYNGGMQFFEGGMASGDKEKFRMAVERFEELLGILTGDEKQKTPLTFLAVAECCYRMEGKENVEKAIGYWKEFLKRWPVEPRVVDVKVALAQGYMTLKSWEEAVGWWEQVEAAAKGNTPVREHALTGQAHCFKEMSKPDEEIGVLERLVLEPEFNTPVSAEGAVRLMSLYALQYDPADEGTTKFADQAVNLLKKLQRKVYLVENFIALNGIAIKLGDELLAVNAYGKALEAYWTVRPRDVVVKMQRARIGAMELKMEQNLKVAGKDPRALGAALRQNQEYFKPRIVEAQKLLVQFEELPDFMPSLYFRMARCFTDMGKKWEAIVVLNQMLEQFPSSTVREVAVFSRLGLYGDLGVADRTYVLCDEYLKEYPAGPHVGDVAFLKGTTAMRKKDWFLAEQNFEAAMKLLATLPEEQKRVYWAEANYQVVNAQFLQNKFEQARVGFESFIAEFGLLQAGKGAFMEDAEYQLALCHLFTGHYMKDPDKSGDGDGAIERLKAYLEKWGGAGGYASDAKYRLAVCHFAANENEQCVKECEDWLAKYEKKKGEVLQPEVYALIGDAKAGMKDYKGAGDAYVRSYQLAKVDEVLNYSLFEAGKMYQKAGDWEAVEKLYTDFVQRRPEHPAAVTSIYWMGKAKAKLGRMEEAKKITVEALQKHIANPKREGVEMMLSQLAEWSRRRPAGAKVGEGEAPLAPWDPAAELEKIIEPLKANEGATAEARLMYARAEMDRILRQPEKRAGVIREITEKIESGDLSPHLLMECGDDLFLRGEVDRAEVLYRLLKENFPKSERVDAGWVGLGDVWLARKDYAKALELFTHAIDRLGAPWKLKEALLGQARCYLELGVLEKAKSPQSALAKIQKAKKIFEEVASVREWRGESTAMALYFIAECGFWMDQFPEASAAFERVTVSQGRYPKWVAKSYIRAAEAYFRQGKDDLAKERLRTVIEPKDEKLAEKFKGLSEVDEARKKLASLGGGV